MGPLEGLRVVDLTHVMAGPTCTLMLEVEHRRVGPVRTIGLPVKFSDTPGAVARGAPLFGQHTREILRECDLADAEIDALLAEGAIAVG